MESSVADAGAVHILVSHTHQIVDRLSPANHLRARQGHGLDLLGQLARLDILVPHTLVLALLNVTVLLLGVIEMSVQSLAADDAITRTGLELSIHHDLVVDEASGSVTHLLLREAILVLEVLNIAVLLMDVAGVLQDVRGSLMLDVSLLGADLLLPELDLMSLHKGNLFRLGLPGTLNSSHISCGILIF